MTKVVRLPRFDAKWAESEIRRIVSLGSDRVIFGNHAMERMEERDITPEEALRVLKNGMIESAPEVGQRQGEWKCKVVMKIRGSRECGVVTIIQKSDRLFIKTVEWEDRR